MTVLKEKYQTTEKLKMLASTPFDLTKEGNLTPERIERFCASACGYRLLYGTERVTEEVMDALYDLANEAGALEWMEKMQSGEILNFIEGFPSENRPVLHTAVRDFFENPNPSPKAKEAANLALAEVNKLKKFMEKIDRENRFTDLVMIAIGGSDLGPRANFFAMQHLQKSDRKVHFISNVDPDDAALEMKGLDLSKTLVVVVSKSGSTLETMTNEELVKRRFQEAGLKPEEHFVSVTAQGSPMDDRTQYLECFYIWDWVGGRFSSTSMVGGVMLSFGCGFETYWELLRGASAMDKAALSKERSRNLPQLLALLGIWNHNFLEYPTVALVPYSQPLHRYSAHIQQVDMESNGKRIDRKGKDVAFQTGPIIWGEPGTNAQHSFFQLIHQGTAAIPLEFIGFRENQYGEDHPYQGTTSREKLLANMFAQAIALATGKCDENPNKVFPGNRPSHLLLGKQLTPFALGALLSLYEHKIAFQGFIWDINSFDQEGVQLGKVLANKILERFRKEAGDAYPLGDTLIRQLELL